MVKGDKVFNSNWTCRDMQYKVGETYIHEGKLELCGGGFHFCRKMVDCFEYYFFDANNKIAEVVALGEIIDGDDKSVTDKIQIVREITWEEMLTLVNTGKGNTGIANTGKQNSSNCNSGDKNSGSYNAGYNNAGNQNKGSCNSGDINSGDHNSGCWNTGRWNAGDYNIGSYNSGYRNTGNYNSGNYNIGDHCTGDFNLSNHNSGCFCTDEATVRLFNKSTNMTFQEWRCSDAFRLLQRISFKPAAWVWDDEMRDKEKKQPENWEATRGYLKECDTSKVYFDWWDSLSSRDRRIIRSIPNFDAEIFERITGIDTTR